MAYNDLLKDYRWINISSLVKERDGFRCRLCNSHDNLQVHHRKYSGKPWQAPLNDLVTLCETCHSNFHEYKNKIKAKKKAKASKKTATKLSVSKKDVKHFILFLEELDFKLFSTTKISSVYKTKLATITVYNSGSIVINKYKKGYKDIIGQFHKWHNPVLL